MPQTLRRICRLYGVLLLAYPRDFRLRFGSEMAATFSNQIRDEWNQSGFAGVCRGGAWRSLGTVFYRRAAVDAKVDRGSSGAFFRGIVHPVPGFFSRSFISVRQIDS